MARVSLRDWVELLLEQGDVTVRGEALTALAGVRVPLVGEALQIALELEGDGPLSSALNDALSAIDLALGPKAAALANDPSAAPFRAQTSPFRPLGLVAAGVDTRTYLAVQMGLKRIVALKVLTPKFAEKMPARRRLLADASKLARTIHPHVATTIDAGEFAGYVFVASEMVDGQSLKQVIEAGGAVDWETSVRLLREACSGLAATHRIGVTHGRLLLSTMLIDREERVKLTEFAPSASPTAPDQAIAQDIADLGLVFLELLAGVNIPRPLTATLPGLPDGVPVPIGQLAYRLVSPPSGERLHDSSELLEALEAALAAARPATVQVAPTAVAGEVSSGAARESTPATPAHLSHARPEPRRLLVVDDEPNILELARLLLQPFDFDVDTALSPEEALRKIERTHYDVVLTDLNFPGGLSGVDLVAALRSIKDTLGVVAMSASQDAEIWEQVLRQGVAGIVAKPLDTTELVAVIERAVSRQRPNLLLVDDSHLARRVFKRFFENRGFAVVVVPGVQEAIGAVKQKVPDVVVTDLHLDDGTGVDVLEYIHQHHPDVRVIIMSAKPDADMVIRAHRLNVFDFVNKSEDPRYLLRSVERIVINHPLAVA